MAKNKIEKKVKVTFENNDGNKIVMDITVGDGIEITTTGEPENLKEHKGLHVYFASLLVKAISADA